MAKSMQHLDQRPQLTVLPGGRQEADEPPAETRRRLFANRLAPFAMVGVTLSLLGALGVRASERLGFTDDGYNGPTVQELRHAPHQVDVIPINEDTATASAIGEYVDPGVYQGPHSSTTETKNLEAVVNSQGGGFVHLDKPVEVPVLDPKAFAKRALKPEQDFIVMPAPRH